MSITRTSLRERLSTTDEFVAVSELVPWRGAAADRAGRASLAAAQALVDDPRIAALSITDNAGGHAMVSPAVVAEEFLARGQDVIVHVSCRDRSRNGLTSLAWDLERRGVRTVLAISGDLPVEGFEGLSRPVFDLDSVGLLALYRDLERQGAGEAAPADRTTGPGFYLGCGVSPFKRLEAEVVPQYLKLALKVRTGAAFVIPQLGYDSRAWDELLHWMRRTGLRVPVLANVFVLSRAVARIFNANRIPGCVVSDELMAIAEREGAAPDKGRAFFLELAARQVAIARGLGFRGVYLAGTLSAADVAGILDAAASFAPDDWRVFAREVAFGPRQGFRMFTQDPETGLATDELEPAYARSLKPSARNRTRRRVSPWYKANRLAHRAVFAPDARGFRTVGRAYGALERFRLGRPLHVLEQAVKVPLYDCRDCGDCSLAEVAYLCPESQCPKGERNGPCGGSHDGHCELARRRCIWVRAYERLKPYGEELTVLERPVAIADNDLRRTSAWANTFLGRDHIARGRP